MMKKLILILSVLSVGMTVSAADSYLKKNDVILTLGDSISAMKFYQKQMEDVLAAVYPDAGIKVYDFGSGGKSSSSGLGQLQAGLSKKPTMVLCMFGVNDTVWSSAGADKKAASFKANIKKVIEKCQELKIPIFLLRETHISHTAAKSDGWQDGVNKCLLTIFKAQDELAAEMKVPVIDVYGYYKSELAKAGKADVKYEFTPDVVHPTQPGHAAMATEVMRALGTGLPLATGDRGPIHLKTSPMSFEIQSANGTATAKDLVEVTIKIKSPKAEDAELGLAFVGGHLTTKTKLKAGEQSVSFKVPLAKLPKRWDHTPLYFYIKTADGFSGGHALFAYSKIASLPYAPANDKLFPHAGKAKAPVSNVKLSKKGKVVSISFDWNDELIVRGPATTKHKFGMKINGPLDLNKRDAQLCDALEFMLDLRKNEGIGRQTADTESNPKGILRVGVCYDKDGKIFIMSLPEVKATIKNVKDKSYLLNIETADESLDFSFTFSVTDSKKYGSGVQYKHTGNAHVSKEAMNFIRFSTKPGIFYRVGY